MAKKYNEVTPEILEQFKAIVPGKVYAGEEINSDYFHDEMPIYGKGAPEVVIEATTTEDIAAIVKVCYENSLPVIPRGAGTGLTGAAVAVDGGVMIDMSKMNKILGYDLENFVVRVEPGVLLNDLAEDAQKQGLLYPPDPGEKFATLGGNVSTNAGGMRAVKYGCTRDYVRAMTVVLPTGEIVKLGATVSKTITGYSLLNLMIGSEGTLGIITELTLKLIPAPKETISLIIPYTDPSLLRNDVKDISVSPFTLVFQHAGLLSAAAIMNAVILTAVLSAGNSGMYASTRMLYTLACDGKAPRIFSKLSRGGVPRNALYATTVIAALCFLTSMFGNQTVYLWLLNTSGMTGFIAWLGIAISHYRFRRGYVLQGNDINNLPYRSGFFPLGPIFAFVLCLIITLGQNYEAFLKDTIDWGGVAATYIGIPLFLVIWFGYKLAKGTRFVRYSEMTFPDRFKR